MRTELAPLEVFDLRSAAVIGQRLEHAQRALVASEPGEETRVNSNVVRHWEESAENLIFDIAVALVSHRSGYREAYRFFPLPKK